jgi:hypothetical protein
VAYVIGECQHFPVLELDLLPLGSVLVPRHFDIEFIGAAPALVGLRLP